MSPEAGLWRDRAAGFVPMQRLLIIAGAILLIAGLLWPLIERFGLGRLPGDIIIERENFRFYFPITTALLVSAVISIILWLFRK